VDGDIIAKPFKGFGGELFIDAFDFLKAGHVGLGLLDPAGHRLQARIHGIDVPGGDSHLQVPQRPPSIYPDPHSSASAGDAW